MISFRDKTYGWKRFSLKFSYSNYDEYIKDLLTKSLKISNGKVFGFGGAAEKLGIHPSTFQSKMRKYNIKRWVQHE